MSTSVKMKDKSTLEQLSARIFLQTGRKFTQQELLAYCVAYSSDNIDDLISNIITENRNWSEDEINDLYLDFVTDLGERTENLSKNVDNILYGAFDD